MSSHVTGFRESVLVALLFVSACVAQAAPATYRLSFDSLPSAQGMSYLAAGVHASTLEANVYALNGGVLVVNSMAEPYAVAGGSAFYVGMEGQITGTEYKRIRASARCFETIGTGPSSDGRGAFCFGFNTGSMHYGCSITPTQVFCLNPSGWVAQPGTFDNSTEFHDYRVDFDPPSTQRVYRDDVLLYTSTTGFPIVANRFFLGDGTGGANARGEVRFFYFEQGSVLDAPGIESPQLALRGAVRNPSPRSRLEVDFALASAAPAEITLLDVTGRRVLATPVGAMGAGSHVVRLDPPASLACGVYWIRLEQAGRQQVRKVVIAE